MRPLLLTFSTVLVAQLAACTCSPPTPVPITMRVVNPTRDPLYLDFTDGRLGLTLQREVGGQLYPFDDLPPACILCGSPGCGRDCPDGGPERVLRLAPDGGAERVWDGRVLSSAAAACFPQGRCATRENAPVNESFDLQLCYRTERPQGMGFDDAGVGEGPLPLVGRTCVHKRFAIQDGVVEIGPQRGAACATSADCLGAGELCFSGACTAGCPANDYPVPSTGGLQVVGPEDMGFFTRAGGRATGSGLLSSVLYQGASLNLSFTRDGGAAGTVSGRVIVQGPLGAGPPLQQGTPVSVLVVDATADGVPNLALVLRDASGGLLFAADMAQGGPALSPADLAPFELGNGPTPIGCTQQGCGKWLYYPRVLDAGVAAVSVEPGKQSTLLLPPAAYTLYSVDDYASASCTVKELRPWLLWRQAAP